MDSFTQLLHSRIDYRESSPSNTPLFQSSSFLQGSPHFYLRKEHPNCLELEQALSQIEGDAYTTVCSSGMAAISLVLRLLKPGDAIAVHPLLYGCSFRLFQEYSSHFNMEVHLLGEKLPSNTKLVFFETPTNPFLKTIDIKKIADFVKRNTPEALIVVDNTLATPLFQCPLKHGADISVVSATKYYSGHSDAMAGVVSTKRKDLDEKIKSFRFYQGNVLEPFTAWLLRRSIQTLEIRMKAHVETTQAMVRYLKECPQIEKVYYPEIDQQLINYGGIIFVQLRTTDQSTSEKIVKSLKLFQWGTSMASVVSSVAIPFLGSHLSLTKEEKEKIGLNPGLIRFSFGLENVVDLKEDIQNAFKAI